MKRFLTLLIILFSLVELSAQKDFSDRRPVWFGVNMGATWQTSDMKPVGGIGWGVTVARYSRMSKPGPLYYGWRFRFLDGRNYGYNYHGLTGIQTNPVLSPYTSGPGSPDSHFVFSNYKMRFDEFAFELVVGSNSLRKHGVLLYGFGAAGINYWKTTTDLTDASGNIYDYSTISTSGDNSIVEPQLEAMWDGEYETNANGSSTGQWSFMPSAGIGFGYQWSNFAIVAEHRTTWALTDLIDGTNHNGVGAATGNNDIYHYDGLTLRWNFSSHSNTNTTNNPPPPPPNPNNYNNTPNNPVTTQTTPPTDPNPTQNNTPQLQPPTVQFTTPNVDPYITSVLNQNLVVRVTNVTSSNQIALTINNQQSTNFSFNPNTQTMTFSHTLLPGNNVYKVVASNSVGTAQDIQTITYKGNDPNPSPLPPQVTITNPASDPYTSTTQTYTVTATVLNVAAASGVQVTRNGSPITNFSFNATNGQLSFVANLQSGNNLYQVVGTNTVGSASDAVTIVYGTSSTTPTPAPPVVTITYPSACPFQTKTAAHTLAATISNVTQKSQVTVVFNNQTITNFTYVQQGQNGTISFPVTLNNGANNLSVTGTNNDGTNNKTCVLTYKPQTPDPIQPPVVTITAPSACPATVNAAAYTITATVTNVTLASQVSVAFNNQTISNFTYTQNGANGNVSFPVTLNSGTNTVSITGTNTAGTDNKSCVITYRVTAPAPPQVTITSPSADPYNTTTAPITFTATVLNVASSAEITVKVNSVNVTGWTYDMNTKVLTYSMTLTPGNTVFKVGAQNANGTDIDQTTVILKENIPTPSSPPVVTITQPSANPFTTTVAQQTIIATVLNVAQQSEITVVKVPSTPVPFTFDPVTHKVTFSVVLALGTNNYKVTATNRTGTANDAVSLILSATAPGNNNGPINPGNSGNSGNTPVEGGNASRPGTTPTAAPTVTVVNPTSNNSHTGDQQFDFALNVMNVTGVSQITVKVNNVVKTTDVNYNAATNSLTFTAALNNGTNVIQVTATNSLGTATKTININYVPSNNRSSGGGAVKDEPKKDEPKKDEPKKAEPKKEEPKKATPTPTPTPTPGRGTTAPSGSQTRPR